MRLGGHVLVDQLRIQGARTVYCLPGESFLPVLDGLENHREAIRTITCRHEANAANMAVASGKLSGRPGICFVTRGPGATQASVGVHTAMQDSVPMILFIGQVPTRFRDREAFQEISYEQMFGGIAKWVASIDSAARIPEYVSRAYAIAMSGRPGPVVLALPENVLSELVDVEESRRVRVGEPSPRADDLTRVHEWLAEARRPTLVVGGSGWDSESVGALQQFAEANQLPVATSFRRQDVFDNRSSSYVGALGVGGRPALIEEVRDSDLVLVVGPRLDAMTTAGYSLLPGSSREQRLVHVHVSAAELGGVAPPDLGIVSSVSEFARAVQDWRLDSGAWRAETERRAGLQAFSAEAPTNPEDPTDLGVILARLREVMPQDTVYCSGAGNFTAWCHRYLKFSAYPSQLAPINGAMGFGLPAGIAAAIEMPSRSVVVIAGDGDFLMASADLATAAAHRLPIIFIVVNNGMYGTIRMHQERHFPGRPIGTELTNPDFVEFFRSFGLYGEHLGAADELEPALERCRASGGPAVLEVRTNPYHLLPDLWLDRVSADPGAVPVGDGSDIKTEKAN